MDATLKVFLPLSYLTHSYHQNVQCLFRSSGPHLTPPLCSCYLIRQSYIFDLDDLPAPLAPLYFSKYNNLINLHVASYYSYTLTSQRRHHYDCCASDRHLEGLSLIHI